MSRQRPERAPAELETLEQVEEWAHACDLDLYDVLWESNPGDVYLLARRSGVTLSELAERMLAARGAEPEPVP